MKTKFAILLSTTSLLHAGAPELGPTPMPKPEPWIKPLIDIRVRYEYADIDAKDQSNALTFRERLGFKTKKWNGFSALVEGEFTQVAVSDYNANAGPDAFPYDPNNSAIADPRNAELNQAILGYDGFDTTLKLGRQKIVYDNAAFIGNVGWRQNEQTYDAISLTNKSIDGLTFNYAYIDQVNRIFGAEADSPLTTTPLFDNVQDISSSINAINASYTGIKGVTLGAYAYLMQFEDKENWENNTFGMSAKGDVFGVTLYGELAWQDQAGFNTDQDAFYSHFVASKTLWKQTFALSVETLGAGFKTPLATIHAFNGYSDVFVGGRTEGNHNGLTDISFSHTIPLFWGLKWTNVFHAFGDNDISTNYGWEYDSVLVKKFNDNFSALAKFAIFESEGDPYITKQFNKKQVGLPDTTRFSVQLDYTF